jgi:hypothetical protein
MGFNNLAETVKTRTRGISVELEGYIITPWRSSSAAVRRGAWHSGSKKIAEKGGSFPSSLLLEPSSRASPKIPSFPPIDPQAFVTALCRNGVRNHSGIV